MLISNARITKNNLSKNYLTTQKTYRNLKNAVLEDIPLKQGLKLWLMRRILQMRGRLRRYSIKTRIETEKSILI